jgi:hypothetical protein
LTEIATTPATAMKEDHSGNFCFCRIVIGRKENFYLPLHASRSFVNVGLPSRPLELCGMGHNRTQKKTTKRKQEFHEIELNRNAWPEQVFNRDFEGHPADAQ